MVSFDARSLVVFSSPIVDFVKFDDKLLVKLDDGKMFISSDGLKWRSFVMEVDTDG